MEEVTNVGLDLAKRVFPVHGAQANGCVVIRKKLSRGQLLLGTVRAMELERGRAVS